MINLTTISELGIGPQLLTFCMQEDTSKNLIYNKFCIAIKYVSPQIKYRDASHIRTIFILELLDGFEMSVNLYSCMIATVHKKHCSFPIVRVNHCLLVCQPSDGRFLGYSMQHLSVTIYVNESIAILLKVKSMKWFLILIRWTHLIIDDWLNWEVTQECVHFCVHKQLVMKIEGRYQEEDIRTGDNRQPTHRNCSVTWLHQYSMCGLMYTTPFRKTAPLSSICLPV